MRPPAEPISYWLREPGPAFDPPPAGDTTADVVIIGGGFTGLWTAIALTDTDPSLRVVVLEAETISYRGQRPERRVLRGVPDARPGERDPALPRRTRAPRTRGRRQPPGPDRVHAVERASTAISRRPACWRWPTSRTRSTSSRRGSTRPPSTARRSSSWIGRPPGPRSTPRSGTPACTGRPGATSWSTRRSCAAASPGSRPSAACGSTSTRRVTGLERRAGGVDVADRSREPPSAPTRSSSRPRPTRAGSAGCRRRSCRSTTTCWCRSR